MTDYITDPHDFCRSCGGRGSFREKTERGTYLTEPCRDCGGTGAKSVRITAAHQEGFTHAPD